VPVHRIATDARGNAISVETLKATDLAFCLYPAGQLIEEDNREGAIADQNTVMAAATAPASSGSKLSREYKHTLR